jgi:hypothetical protein
VAACKDEVAPDDAGTVAVSPSAALLTTVGDGMSLRALDAEGQPVSGAITWQSSNPDVVSIDADGRITARAAVGSAQITATRGDTVSAPVLVLVAEPAPGAILVADADVVADPTADDAAAPFGLGYRLRFTAAPHVAVAPGAIVLAREGKPIAGRVVSAQPGAAGTDVVFETVAVPDLFRKLSVDDTYRIDAAALEAALEQQPSARIATAADDTFNIGPLICKKPSVSFSALTSEATLRLEPDLTLVRHLTLGDDGQVSSASAILSGSLAATGTLTLKFTPAIEGKISCQYKITSITLPIGGPISIIGGLLVPIGVKGEISFGLQAAELELGVEIVSTSQTTIGFTYTAETGMTPIADMTERVDIKPKHNMTESGFNAFAIIGVAVGPTIGLDAGIHLPLLGNASISLLEAWLQLKAEAQLSHPMLQLAEPTGASKYEAKVGLTVGPGSDAKKALELLSGAVTLRPSVKIERKLARSPVGTMTRDRAEVPFGQSARLDINLDPSTTTFLGVRNLDEIRIYHTTPGGDVEVLATLPASEHTSFNWHPTITDFGTHTFWAAVVTVLGPGIPLEIKEDSSVTISVVHATPAWHGQISFQASGDESSTSGQFTNQYTLSASGTSNVAQSATAPEFLDEVSATGSLDHVEVVTFTPEPVGDPDACVYATVKTTTTSGNSLAPPTPPTAQFYVDEISGAYALYFQPTSFAATRHTVTVATLVSGPATCEPSSTTTSDSSAMFKPEDMFAMGTFTPGATTITGTAMMMTGLSPVASYQMSWTLMRN